MVGNVTVIIRAAGERTVNSCYEILKKQVPESSIFKIEEVPFSKAVIRTFEIGIEQQKKWTLAIDADLLLLNNAVIDMVEAAEKMPEKLYIYQGMILDYLFGRYRFAGPHLYRTSVLTKAIKIVKSNTQEIRPESYTYKKLANQGYITYCDNKCYALHEYEQYTKDYFRKGFFHGIKALDDQLLVMLRHWRSSLKDNNDYEIALKGLVKGLTTREEIKIDINFFQSQWHDFVSGQNYILADMPSLDIEHDYVQNKIQKHKIDYPNIQPDSYLPYYLDETGKHIVKSMVSNKLVLFVSNLFLFLGKKLVKLGNEISKI